MGVGDVDEAALADRYGTWVRRTPVDVAALFRGYPGTWWIAGGWALQAFTGLTRNHDDIDPSILRAEFPHLRRHLADRMEIWTATRGELAPLAADGDVDRSAAEILPEGCGQVWARRRALGQWEYDILLCPGTAAEWVYKRDDSIRMPIADALWQSDGVSYLQPEIQLLYKAPGCRAKDAADFAATLPYLDAHRRAWLRGALVRTLGEHPWISSL